MSVGAQQSLLARIQEYRKTVETELSDNMGSPVKLEDSVFVREVLGLSVHTWRSLSKSGLSHRSAGLKVLAKISRNAPDLDSAILAYLKAVEV